MLFYRDLETVFEEQRDAHSNLKDLMDQKDTQSSTEISELTKELKEKHEQIANLVEQLNIHQNNFESLKTELCEVNDLQNVFPWLVLKRLTFYCVCSKLTLKTSKITRQCTFLQADPWRILIHILNSLSFSGKSFLHIRHH